MRTATLYSTEKKLVKVHGGFIPYHVREPIRIINSNDILEMKSVVDIHHLPVERWVFDEQEYLIALDPQLRDIVNSMIATSEDAVRRTAQVKIKKLNSEIDRLQSRTIWDMIVLRIKQGWSK